MIPGQALKPQDLLNVARRRAAILIPFLLVSICAAVVIHRLPNRYRSETMILVVPQRVPESYVRSTVTSRIEDRLRSINQQLVSRTRLEPLIREFNLYPDLVASGLMEDVIEQMRKDMETQILRGDTFRIAYTANDPRTAMKVTERLASLYIDENLRDREVLADGTNQFLDSQLDDAKARLIEHEKKLEEYNTRYAGQLPTQVQSNLQVIQNTQLQIQSIVDSLARDRDRRLGLEGTLTDMMAVSSNNTPDTSPHASAELGPAAAELATAQKTLAELRQRLKTTHPDVLRQQRLIATLQKKADDEAAAATLASPAAVPSPDPGDVARLTRVNQLRGEIEALGRQIAQKEDQESRLRGVAADYQARVDAAPARESELVELTRDYQTLQRGYTSLLSKKEDAQVAANLERHQIGEQFRILDPARMPEKPISPNRTRLYALSAGVGLACGLFLAVFLEYRDTTLKTEADVVAALALPVLALIPELMTGEQEQARGRRRRMLSWLTAGTAAAAALGGMWVLKMMSVLKL
jgi:polysaccharide chain length determinant protein (PEP-CTERM system associated)